MQQAKKRNIIIVGLVLVLMAMVWIYLAQPFLTIERLSLLKSVHGDQAEVKRTYLFQTPNYLKAFGYTEHGHLYASEALEVEFPESLKDEPILLTSFYGFDQDTDESVGYAGEFENDAGEEKTLEIHGHAVRIKTDRSSDPLGSKIIFNKGSGWYFIRTQAIEPMEEALYEDILQFLLDKTLE